MKAYFNPHPYPIQIAISDLNLVIGVAPGDPVKDTKGRPINDPILGRYVNKNGLAVELAPKPVPVLLMPANPVQRSSVRRNPVGSGFRDENGKWHPPAPPTVEEEARAMEVAPPVSRPSWQGMSLDEAKRRGFVGAQRLVSEDYGRSEVPGAPDLGSKLPPIRHSIEAAPRAAAARARPLAQEYLDEVQPGASAMVQGLQKVAEQVPEAPPAQFRSDEINETREAAGVYAMPEKQQRKVATPVNQVPPTPPAWPQAPRRIAKPVAAAPVQVPETNFPEPHLDGDPERAEGVADVLTQETDEAQDTMPKPRGRKRTTEPKVPIVCDECGKTYAFPSQLKNHKASAHKVKAPIAVVPVDETSANPETVPA